MKVDRQDFEDLISRFKFVFFSGQATAEDRFYLGDGVSEYLEKYPDFHKDLPDRERFWWIACAAMDNASDNFKEIRK